MNELDKSKVLEAIKECVSFVFGKIEKEPFDKEKIIEAYNEHQFDGFDDDLKLDSSKFIDRKKIPKIKFTITSKDIEELKSDGLLVEKDGGTFFSPFIANAEFPVGKKVDPLIRLMYAVLWKNGDLLKVSRIISGITKTPADLNPQGFVFQQFGKFLADPGEPIIDQHVMRVFKIYKTWQTNHDVDLEPFFKKGMTNSDANAYIAWVKDIVHNKNASRDDIDEILFALGKAAKKLWQKTKPKNKVG